MGIEQWSAVDRYFGKTLLPQDAVLEAVLMSSRAAGLPEISVSPAQGALLGLLAQAIGARRILEIGTLGGYSTIWLARALPPGGRLITLEANAKHAAVARSNIDSAGLSGCVELREGPALDTLPQLAVEGAGPFDLVFIDADKPSNPQYLAWALRLSRIGALIIVDNVVRRGAVLEEAGGGDVQGVREMVELVAAEPRLLATALQTVGVKGWDGLLLALVTTPPDQAPGSAAQ